MIQINTKNLIVMIIALSCLSIQFILSFTFKIIKSKLKDKYNEESNIYKKADNIIDRLSIIIYSIIIIVEFTTAIIVL